MSANASSEARIQIVLVLVLVLVNGAKFEDEDEDDDGVLRSSPHCLETSISENFFVHCDGRRAR
jgi:hypothetical protein